MPYYKGFAAGLSLRFSLDMGRSVHEPMGVREAVYPCEAVYLDRAVYPCEAVYLCRPLYLSEALYLGRPLYLYLALYLCVLLSRIVNKLSLYVLLL